MKEIQVDMFEVQLGASILLQFKRDEENWVSILADAGINASGYDQDHVHKKLLQQGTLNSTNQNKKRIDLIIGTHYDKDHLYGLIPVIKDTTIDIGEAWLPPVANDTQLHAIDDAIDETSLLAFQFAEENGEEILARYLEKKYHVCQKMSSLIKIAHIFNENEFFKNENNDDIHNSKIQEYFEKYLRKAIGIIGNQIDSHEILEIENSINFSDFYYYDYYKWYNFINTEKLNEVFQDRWNFDQEYIQRDKLSFAYIMKASAKDAITALHLYRVVKELKARNITIYCQTIDKGDPQYFNWNSSQKRFIRAKQKSTIEPTLTLLGPSKSLVKKHWNRLPLGSYMKKLAYTHISIKSITPSNQLSYVIRFEYDKQGILITGDAGFVDFSKKRGKYYQSLINELLPLQVVQVAHHGGNNAHFYNVLLKAGYANYTEKSFLLLSHATKDKKRPSKAFEEFIDQVKSDHEISLLFTSEPEHSKVKQYKNLIFPVIPSMVLRDKGDVRIQYTSQQNWNVLQHCIKV